MPQSIVEEVRNHVPNPVLSFFKVQHLKPKIENRKSKIKNPLPDHTRNGS